MITILPKLIGKDVYDVMIYGVVDTEEEPVEFLPVLSTVFLTVGELTVRLLRDETTARLVVSESDEAVLPFELESGHRICQSSIRKFVLNNPNADNRIQRIVVHNGSEDSVGALEIVLQSGQTLFFDPTFFDGINFGGVEQKAIWQENANTDEVQTIQ